MNLELYLWLAVAVTFVFWLLDLFIWRKKRKETGQSAPWVVEFFGSFFPIFIVIMLLRSFVIEPFRIPSASMEPTLYSGDMIAVKKWTYGLKMPITNATITEGRPPARGDIVVFKKPGDEDNFFIKRVVGVPGDEVNYSQKRLTINGETMAYDVLSEPSAMTQNRYRAIESIAVSGDDSEEPAYREHEIFFNGFIASGDNVRFTVPEGEYMMMGDNRDNSLDSRFWGMVPEENILGEAAVIWMNLNCITFNGGCGRIGTVLY